MPLENASPVQSWLTKSYTERLLFDSGLLRMVLPAMDSISCHGGSGRVADRASNPSFDFYYFQLWHFASIAHVGLTSVYSSKQQTAK